MVSERPACSIDGCDNESAARGWCKRHYNQWRKTGTPTVKPRKTPDPCSNDDCDQPSAARGMCKKHWHQWRRNEATEDQLQTTGRRWRGITDQYALTGGEWRVDKHGIQRWHGDVPADEPDEDTEPRLATRQERPGQPVPLTPDDERHGTLAGYRAHLRNGIPTCDDCLRAAREDSARRYGGKTRDRLDEAAIQQYMSGNRTVRLSPRERAEVCRRWYESGRSMYELAKITGWRTDRYFKVSEAA